GVFSFFSLLHINGFQFIFILFPPPFACCVPTIRAHPLSFNLPLFLHHHYIISTQTAKVFISIIAIALLHNWVGVDVPIPAPTSGGDFIFWCVRSDSEESAIA
ncbi:hypothetical protein V8G54_014099, partial [Vigna mungo]